jgi:uncharacterized membrane protein YgdD (TMEM256/DUF423 family)
LKYSPNKVIVAPVARAFLLLGSLFAFGGVAAGAFGSHVLQSRLSHEMLDIFEIGVRYQMYHALALLAVGLACLYGDGRWLRRAGGAFAAGILIFSGSLYLLALTGTRWWGAITPIGGVGFLAGWLCLAAAFWSNRDGG